MSKYSGSGWHFQSQRHSDARKTGHAGGTYATKETAISVVHSEPKSSLRYKQIPIYHYDDAPKELKEKILNNYRDINVDYDWWDFDGLFDPTTEEFKKLGTEFKKQYDKDTKKGYSMLNNFKIEAFDLDRDNYLQIKNIDTKNEKTFLQQIGLTKDEAKKVYNVRVQNDRDRDSTLILNFNETSNTENEKEQDNIQSKAQEGFSDLIHNAKKSLRENYDYLLSDEQVEETLRANEYNFDEKGKIA